jgi:hypothetical protein
MSKQTHRLALCRILLHPSKIRTPIARIKGGDLVLDLEQKIPEEDIAIWGELCIWEDLPNEENNIWAFYPQEYDNQFTLKTDDVEEILRQVNTDDRHNALVYVDKKSDKPFYRNDLTIKLCFVSFRQIDL